MQKLGTEIMAEECSCKFIMTAITGQGSRFNCVKQFAGTWLYGIDCLTRGDVENDELKF